jgi:hypothetical protein
MRGKILTHNELVEHLEELTAKVKSGACLEGTISWNNGGDKYYDVVAFARVTNSFGQEDAFLIGELEV